jgi:long-subunit fatty acid transport protein
LLLSLIAAAAWATVPDSYGPGARLIGMGGGGVAVVEDGAAALVNPAGLYRIRRPTVAVGVSLVHDNFDPVPALYWDTNRDGTVDDRDPPLAYDAGVADAFGFHFSAGRNIGGKFALGISAYTPAARLLEFKTFEPSLPTYFMYDDRPQRYTLAAAIGGQIVKGLAIGGGIDFVPKARLKLMLQIDGSVTGTDDTQSDVSDLVGDITIDVHQIDVDIVPDFAPILGVQLDVGQWVPPLKGLWLAAAYRGSVGLPISVDLDLQANIAAEDIGDMDPLVFAIIMDTQLRLFDHYVPSVLSLGAAYRNEDTLTVSIDVRNTNWKKMELNVAKVVSADITSPLIDIDDLIHDGNDFTVQLRSVWGLRMGAELNLPKWTLNNDFRYVRVCVRGGFQYEPSALASQGPTSALLDADRMGFSVGAGFESWDPWELIDGPWRIDVFAQYHVLATGALQHGSATPAAGYPIEGNSIPIGGNILVAGAQWGFDY